MKNKRNVLCCLFITLAGVTYFPVQAQQKNDTQDVVYQLDVKKSKLLWKAPKNQHRGFILFNAGTLSNFATGKPSQGSFSINMNSMKSTDETSDAGRKKLDDKLRSEEFFAVSKYPAATMLVKQVLQDQNTANYRVSGELTIKGATKPIEFTAVMKQSGNTITASANMNISRAKWNIGHQPQPPAAWDFVARLKDNLIDNDIPINLQLVFIKKQL